MKFLLLVMTGFCSALTHFMDPSENGIQGKTALKETPIFEEKKTALEEWSESSQKERESKCRDACKKKKREAFDNGAEDYKAISEHCEMRQLTFWTSTNRRVYELDICGYMGGKGDSECSESGDDLATKNGGIWFHAEAPNLATKIKTECWVDVVKRSEMAPVIGANPNLVDTDVIAIDKQFVKMHLPPGLASDMKKSFASMAALVDQSDAKLVQDIYQKTGLKIDHVTSNKKSLIQKATFF